MRKGWFFLFREDDPSSAAQQRGGGEGRGCLERDGRVVLHQVRKGWRTQIEWENQLLIGFQLIQHLHSLVDIW